MYARPISLKSYIIERNESRAKPTTNKKNQFESKHTRIETPGISSTTDDANKKRDDGSDCQPSGPPRGLMVFASLPVEDGKNEIVSL